MIEEIRDNLIETKKIIRKNNPAQIFGKAIGLSTSISMGVRLL